MKEAILVITDKTRNIRYFDILPFYSVKLLSTEASFMEKIDDVGAVIIDLAEERQGFEKANSVRTMVPWMPLLFITDVGKPQNPALISCVKGFGLTRVYRWRSNYTEGVLDSIQGLMHPEYPSAKNDVAIVLPVYNEESRFHNVYEFVLKLRLLIDYTISNCNIFFVNDGSHDRTEELVKLLIEDTAKENSVIQNRPMVSDFSLKYNTRKAGTYIEALRTIDADIIVLVDADNSFEVEDIATMINLLQDGYYDMIIGTKDMTAEHRAPVRKLLSACKRIATKPLLPKGVSDSQTGLKAMKRATAANLLPYLHENTGLAIDLEMVYTAKKLNFRVFQLAVKCIDREGTHIDIVRDSIRFLKIIFRLLRGKRKLSNCK